MLIQVSWGGRRYNYPWKFQLVFLEEKNMERTPCSTLFNATLSHHHSSLPTQPWRGKLLVSTPTPASSPPLYHNLPHLYQSGSSTILLKSDHTGIDGLVSFPPQKAPNKYLLANYVPGRGLGLGTKWAKILFSWM